MNTPPEVRQAAPRRYTSAALTGGVLVAAFCFVLAVAAEVVGIDPGSGEMTDLAAVLDGLVSLTPWAWATAGAYAIVLTPVAGLLATAWEYSTISDRRSVWLAVAVIGVLAVSASVALLR